MVLNAANSRTGTFPGEMRGINLPVSSEGKPIILAESNSRTGTFLAGKRETLRKFPIRNFSLDTPVQPVYFPDRE